MLPGAREFQAWGLGDAPRSAGGDGKARKGPGTWILGGTGFPRFGGDRSPRGPYEAAMDLSFLSSAVASPGVYLFSTES